MNGFLIAQEFRTTVPVGDNTGQIYQNGDDYFLEVAGNVYELRDDMVSQVGNKLVVNQIILNNFVTTQGISNSIEWSWVGATVLEYPKTFRQIAYNVENRVIKDNNNRIVPFDDLQNVEIAPDASENEIKKQLRNELSKRLDGEFYNVAFVKEPKEALTPQEVKNIKSRAAIGSRAPVILDKTNSEKLTNNIEAAGGADQIDTSTVTETNLTAARSMIENVYSGSGIKYTGTYFSAVSPGDYSQAFLVYVKPGNPDIYYVVTNDEGYPIPYAIEESINSKIDGLTDESQIIDIMGSELRGWVQKKINEGGISSSEFFDLTKPVTQ